MLQLSLGSVHRVLCLGAHSDDIEIGAGGTLLKLAAQVPDLDICWVVFSAPEARVEEARHSAVDFLAGLARKEIKIGSFRESYFPSEWASIKDWFEQIRADIEPDVVFTHYRDDRHQDHRVLSDLAWNTFRNHLILEYEIPKYDGDLGHPNVFMPLSEKVCARKIELLLKHFKSQSTRHWFTSDTFAAGGFLSLANERKVRLLRENRSTTIDVSEIRMNPSLDVHVQPGDRIEVPSVLESSKNSDDKPQQDQQNAAVASSHPVALETQLNENGRNVAEVQRKKAEEEGQPARKNADLTAAQLDALETRLKKAQAEAQTAQQAVDQEASQSSALQTQLKEIAAKTQQALKDAALAASQGDSLKAQLEETRAKAKQVQKDAALAASQRDALQAQLKDTEAKVQQVQKKAELATSQRDGLQNQLKDTEAGAQQAQKNVELVTSQRDALQSQVKELTQKNAELPADQRDALQTRLNDAEARAQEVQKSLEL